MKIRKKQNPHKLFLNSKSVRGGHVNRSRCLTINVSINDLVFD